jgi:hypothetical protein
MGKRVRQVPLEIAVSILRRAEARVAAGQPPGQDVTDQLSEVLPMLSPGQRERISQTLYEVITRDAARFGVLGSRTALVQGLNALAAKGSA